MITAEKQRYFFHIAYDGASYNGWQKLPQANSVQQVLETVLTRVIKIPVNINGCGRTDTHVHASQYFFHADLFKLGDTGELLYRINKSLPSKIAVFDIIPVQPNHHARLDAVERSYDYFIHRNKDPFLNSYSSFYEDRNLDVDKMKVAAALLPRYHDYQHFHRLASKPRTTICKVTRAQLVCDRSESRLRFSITANRFIQSMIRIIVHRLLEVGNNQLSLEEFEGYLKGTIAPKERRSAYPQGLHLSKVTYPFLDLPRKGAMLSFD